MDALDRKLLVAIQADNLQTADALGEQIGLSPSACLRRLRRLRETGAIEADVAVVSPERVGRPLTMVVQVTLERERPDLIDAFKRTMQATPEVMQCYYVTGDTDFVLIVTASSMHDYEAFTKRVFFENPNIRRFQTQVVMDRVKVGLAVPIET